MVIPLLAALQFALMGGGESTPTVFVKKNQEDKRQFTPADYATWDEVITSDLTPDGKVFAVELKRDGLSRVEWRETTASQKYTIDEAQEPRFSTDGKWLTYVKVSGKTKGAVAKNLQEAEAITVTGAESIKFVGSDAFFEGDNFFTKVNLGTRKQQERLLFPTLGHC
ncbi:MAG: hypothetical protein K8R88_10315 [Armatimonadetes bacterium]|nr:hypothetical protein [Armatimonadota bacterium]